MENEYEQALEGFQKSVKEIQETPLSFNVGTRLPNKIDNFFVMEDGTLERDGMTNFPWFNKDGYLGGTVRYRLIAEDVDVKELFKTQETQ